MTRYRGVGALLESGAELGTTQKYADRSAAKSQKVREANETAVAVGQEAAALRNDVSGLPFPPNDGAPPAAPAGLTASVSPHTVDLLWDIPPQDDYVAYSLVTVTPQGEAAYVERKGAFVAGMTDLASKPHTFSVKFVDYWGLVSAASATVTATPMLTAAETVDLGELAMLERLNGLLPNANLATLTDATKLGTGVVLARAMAVQDAAAFNLWASNAMIRSAAIESLVADKITAGTITAGTIALAGSGRVTAGPGVSLNSTGLTLAAAPAYAASTVDVDRKITPVGNLAGLHFYAASTERGAVARAQGNSTEAARVVLEAANSSTGTGSYVIIRANANGTGDISINAAGTVYLEGPTYVTGSLNPNGGIIPNFVGNPASVSAGGTGVSWNHNLGVVPRYIFGQLRIGTDNWVNLPASNILVSSCTPTSVTITNNQASGSVSSTVRVFLIA